MQPLKASLFAMSAMAFAMALMTEREIVEADLFALIGAVSLAVALITPTDPNDQP